MSPLQDRAGLAGKGRESSREDLDTTELVPRGEPPCPAQQVRTMSKWEQCLGSSSHLDTEPLTPLQRGLRPIQAAQAEQGAPRAQTPREGGLCRLPGARQSPQTTHTPMPGPSGSVGGSLSSHRAQAPGQRVCPWSKGCRHVLHSCVCVTFLKLERTLMTICELKLVCYSCRHICHMNPSIQ